MKALVKENILSLKPYTAPKEIATVRLDANENPFNLFSELKEEFINKIQNLDMNRYPEIDNMCLAEKIAEYAGVKHENIICGNGSDEIIQIIINCFVEKGDYVVMSSPTFSMYRIFTQIAGGIAVEVPADGDFNIREEELINTANEKGAKIIFICNPNNPTGTVTRREIILKILNCTNSIVVVDEAYYEFLGQTVVDKINNSSRLIVLRTLSKAFALAGARIGYGIASKETIEVISRLRAPYNVSSLSQTLGILFLENVNRVREKIEEIKNERSYIIGHIEKLDEIKVYPTGGNFILIKTDRAEAILRACFDGGISLRDFSDSCNNIYIRITVGKREENDKLINLIKRVVQI